ncbi:hypothetical protein CFP65_0347 [Kitasatospora sp. MMS16-BH015]|uniref:hypothetical protein n=1 Tax=Kitasatospora sp. MMS16-BH015 TaxID=2018025 RepID=UPI000CA319A1|nr:hypothetical protein [Kitasatospora sp. MMS16-BH015]AUG75319.1 hypothetical protein CFP65_0347 [Kitasatospora sp. MMS16-BH015]
MTIQGERAPRPAGGPEAPVPATVHRSRRTPSRRILVGAVLAVLAAGAGWIVTRPHPGDWIPGLGPTSAESAKSAPTAAAVAAPTQTSVFTPESFTADRYFPAARAVDLDDFKGRRTAGRQGGDCAESLADRAHNLFVNTGCQGYVSVGFARTDQQLLGSVTVLRFGDAGAAAKMSQTLDAAAFAFTTEPELPVPAGRPSTRIEAVGQYVTVTTVRSTDTHAARPDLDAAARALSYTAGASFGWM